MFDVEPKSEEQAWERRFASEIQRLNEEADQRCARQQPPRDEEAPPADWDEAAERMVARLEEEAGMGS